MCWRTIYLLMRSILDSVSGVPQARRRVETEVACVVSGLRHCRRIMWVGGVPTHPEALTLGCRPMVPMARG